MSDNTTLNTGSGGDVIRAVAKTATGAKAQVMILDVGGGGDGASEVALTLGQQTSGLSVPVVIASDQQAAATAKGTQGGTFAPVQQPKDSGRTYLTLTANRVTGVAAAALLTLTQNKGGTTSSSTSYTVTTGKTLRIQNVSATVRGSSTAAAVNGVVALLTAASGIATTSPALIVLDVPAVANTSAAGDGGQVDLPIPDGLEIAAGQQIALSQSCSTTSSTVSVTLIGYEY
jgi:hypothetical protein